MRLEGWPQNTMVRDAQLRCAPHHEAVPRARKTWMAGSSPAMTHLAGIVGRVELAALVLALETADVLLGVEFEPDASDQVKLGFEEIDVVFLVLHQAFEQVA